VAFSLLFVIAAEQTRELARWLPDNAGETRPAGRPTQPEMHANALRLIRSIASNPDERIGLATQQ
jgi:hypothetical protein